MKKANCGVTSSNGLAAKDMAQVVEVVSKEVTDAQLEQAFTPLEDQLAIEFVADLAFEVFKEETAGIETVEEINTKFQELFRGEDNVWNTTVFEKLQDLYEQNIEVMTDELDVKLTKVSELFGEPGTELNNPFLLDVLKQFNQRGYGLTFSKELTTDERENWQVTVNTVDTYTRLGDKLKLKLSNLTKMKLVNDELVPELGFLNNEVKYPLGYVHGILMHKLGNSPDPDLYMQRLTDNDNHPVIRQLFDNLTDREEAALNTEIYSKIAQNTKYEYIDSIVSSFTFLSMGQEETITTSFVTNANERTFKQVILKQLLTDVKVRNILVNNGVDGSDDFVALKLTEMSHAEVVAMAKKVGLMDTSVTIPADQETNLKLLLQAVQSELGRGMDIFAITNKPINSNALEGLADFLTRHQDATINTTHRNAKGETVNEFNRSNYLTRFITTFQELRGELRNKKFAHILNDPHYKNSVLLQHLKDGIVKIKIINSLKLRGETQATEYSNMVERQLAIQQLMVFNQSPNSFIITNPTHSDAGIQTGLEINKKPLEYEAAVEEILKLAIRERALVDNRPDLQEGNGHIFFDYLDGVDPADFKKTIQTNVARQVKEYQKYLTGFNIIEDSNSDKGLVGVDGLFRKDNVNDLTAKFLMNQLVYQTEAVWLLNGDPSFYGKIDYSKKEGKGNGGIAALYKRAKQIWSPVIFTMPGAKWYPAASKLFSKFKNGIKVRETFKMQIFSEVDTFTQSFQDWLTEYHPDYKGNFNTSSLTDAQSFIDPIRFLEQSIGLAEWTQEKQDALERVIMGQFNQSDEVLFGAIKPFYFNFHERTNADGSTYAHPFQNKDSEIVMLPYEGIEIQENGKPNPNFNPFHKFMLEKMGYEFTKTSVSITPERIHERLTSSTYFDKFTFDSAVKAGHNKSDSLGVTDHIEGSKSVEERVADILQKYLSNFGISVQDIEKLKDDSLDELGVADILSKIAYIKDRKDLPPVAGKFIAYMMQYNPLVSNIIKDLATRNGEYKEEYSAIYFVGSGLGKSTLAAKRPDKFKDMDDLIGQAVKKAYPKKTFNQKDSSELLWKDDGVRTALRELIDKYKDTHIILSPINKSKLKSLGYSYTKYYTAQDSSRTVADIANREKDAYTITEDAYNELYKTPYAGEKNLVEVGDYISNEFTGDLAGEGVNQFGTDFFTITNYNELDKDKYLDQVGNLIAKGLKNKLHRTHSLYEKIKKVIKEFFNSDIKGNVEMIQQNITKIVDGIVNQDKDMITASKFKPGAAGKTVSKVSIEQALTKDAFGKSIIEKLSQYKFILTGSTALSEQGTILRPEENPLHDIDWVSPYNSNQTADIFKEEYPDAIKIRDIVSEDYVTDTYLIAPEGHSVINADIVDYNGRIIVNSYDVANAEGKVVGTFRFKKPEGGTRKKEIITGVEAKLIDFFSPTNDKLTPPPFEYTTKEGLTIYLANWKATFKAKLEYARIKDIWDYNRFIPNGFEPYVDNSRSVVEMDSAAYGKQMETPNHIFDDEQKMAVQVRKNIIKDINPEQYYNVAGKATKGSDLIINFNKLELANLKIDLDKVNQTFFTKEGEVDMPRILQALQLEVNRRDLDSRYLELLQVTPTGGTPLPLDHPAFVYTVRQVVNAMYSKRVITQKLTNGVSYVNLSPAGYTPPQVKFRNGAIDYYEAYAPIHNSALKQFIKPNEVLDKATLTERAMEAGISEVNVNKMIDGIVWRIPNEGPFTIFHIKVTKFFASERGGSIVLPLEITTIGGID